MHTNTAPNLGTYESRGQSKTNPMHLSICIPTYKRSQELNELLNSILSASAEVPSEFTFEICISDNNCNSDDGTMGIISYYASKFRRILYQKNDQNLGPHRNMMRSLVMGSGDFLWLVGSDDKITKTSLEDIFKMITTANPSDLYILNRFKGDENAFPIAKDSYFNVNSDHTVNYWDKRSRLTFLSSARTVDALGCFYSSLLFSRRFFLCFREFSSTYELYASNIWGHMGALQQTLCEKGQFKLTYCVNSFTVWRSGNSCIAAPGIGMKKRVHMFKIIKSLAVDKDTKKLMSKIAKSHYAKFGDKGYIFLNSTPSNMGSQILLERKRDWYLYPLCVVAEHLPLRLRRHIHNLAVRTLFRLKAMLHLNL